MRIAIVADVRTAAEEDCSRDPHVLADGLRLLGHQTTLLEVSDADSKSSFDGVLSPSAAHANRGFALLNPRPDVIVSVGIEAPAIAAVLADSLAVPLVICLSPPLFGSFHTTPGYGRLVCGHLPHACLVVESESQFGAAARFGAEHHRTFVVRPGVRLEHYRVPPGTRLEPADADAAPLEEFRLICDVSRTPLEEQRFLERVLTRLSGERHRSVHTLVFTTAEAGRVSPDVRDLWQGRPATTLVQAPDYAAIPALYAGCDIAVIPGAIADETVPTLRAMAAGRPLVAADCLPIQDVVGTARHGVLARPGLADEWVDKLDYVTQTPALRLHIAKSARTQAELSFSLTQHFRHLEERLCRVTASWRYGADRSTRR